MENYNNISSDTGQDKKGGQSLWRITKISVMTLDKIKMKDNQYGEFQQYHSDNGQEKSEGQSVWRITTISVLTLNKIKLSSSQCEKLEQCQF